MQCRLDNKILKSISWQLLLFACFGGLLWAAIYNLDQNLQQRGIASGFGFLDNPAGFDVLFSVLPFQSSDSYAWAFITGALNTLLVSFLSVIAATAIGFTAGLILLSPVALFRHAARIYVEMFRNIPLLLHLFLFYFVVLRSLPMPQESWNLSDAIFLNIRGLYFPWGETPKLDGLNFSGGICLPPEFLALFLALAFYTGAFIAEIVRSGLESVPKGQTEAARALGLSSRQVYRYVLLPQGLRVMVPPLISQFLNLLKNSSLAAAIAYPDLVLIFAGTVLNQTGQAVEVIAITMVFFMTLSLLISLVLNQYNRSLTSLGKT